MPKPLKVADFEYVCRPAYVESQVIVTGREGDVHEVVAAAFDDPKVNPLHSVVLEWPLSRPLSRFPGEDEGRGPVIISLYDTGQMSVIEAIQGIYRQALELSRPVFPDPNLVTGHPHIPVGSPHIPVGSPGTREVGPPVTEDDFWKQPAFSAEWGTRLTADTGARRTELAGNMGRGIHVGVFDTSPLEDPGLQGIPGITPALELDVTHLLRRAGAQDGPTADHGLFVTSLVHAVAPDSTKYLFQVLDEKAEGTLHTLIRALIQFMNQRLMANNNGTLNNTVMNLSLGFPQPEDPGYFGFNGLLESHSVLLEALGINGPHDYAQNELPVVSLETVMWAADQLTAVVVAAAGNESSPQVLRPPEVPAAYPSVIGVAASNKDQGRSCFSNRGDVAAPGGDTHVARTGACLKELVEGKENIVIGLAPHTSPDTGYACWVGTSFSAPLVSGLAALMLEAQRGLPLLNQIRVKRPAPPQPSPLGKGIIDVPDSVT